MNDLRGNWQKFHEFPFWKTLVFAPFFSVFSVWLTKSMVITEIIFLYLLLVIIVKILPFTLYIGKFFALALLTVFLLMLFIGIVYRLL